MIDTYGAPKVGIAPARFVHAADAAAKFYLGVLCIVAVRIFATIVGFEFWCEFSWLIMNHHALPRDLGLAARKSTGAAAAPYKWSAAFAFLSMLYMHGYRFTVGRVGTPARVCRFLRPVRQPCTVHHLCLAAVVMG